MVFDIKFIMRAFASNTDLCGWGRIFMYDTTLTLVGSH